ncbi:permease [Candidatus Peregrinibacteria bacterium]|nr:permease [Candidatus Peregrinibacteria bacterium]
MKHEASCEHCVTPAEPIRLGRKLKIVGGFFIVLFTLSYLPALAPLNESLVSYLKVIWWAILLGLLIGGLIDHFIPENFVFKYLGQRKVRTIFYAVIAGFLMSACSHGILAISMQLYKKGASTSSIVTFLLASPWANLPVTILLFGFFGWKALLFILAAMVIAVITGLIYMILEKADWVETHQGHRFDTSYQWTAFTNFNLEKAAHGTLKGAVDLANMILWWILIGFMLAGVIGAYVPAHIFTQYFGPDFLGMVLTLLFATIIEVCSEGSAPIAFEIFNKVGTLGNPFIFLMAGVVTDYTEIGLIWSNIGKKAAIWLPIITVPQVLLVAYLFNLYL